MSCVLGFLVAFFQTHQGGQTMATFSTKNIPPTDVIVLSNQGDIYQVSHQGSAQITHGQHLIEPVKIGNTFAAIEKTTNYASLLMFDQQGNIIKTLFSGNNDTIDTMSWITDPAASPAQNRIAYVSDKDKAQTNVPDNALYVLNLATGKSTNVAKPSPYSGGLAHPLFNPVNSNIILYDYYQYDPQTLMPYSTIEQFDNTTGLITTLTFENQNAYQAAFSPDGKQLLFLGRNDGSTSVTLYIADFDSTSGLSNIRTLLSGDLAYPAFSNTKNVIYYLQAQGNSGYNLMNATIQNNKLSNIQTVVSGNILLGNSSYAILKKE